MIKNWNLDSCNVRHTKYRGEMIAPVTKIALLFYFFDIQSVCSITIINNILKITISILFI